MDCVLEESELELIEELELPFPQPLKPNVRIRNIRSANSRLMDKSHLSHSRLPNSTAINYKSGKSQFTKGRSSLIHRTFTPLFKEEQTDEEATDGTDTEEERFHAEEIVQLKGSDSEEEITNGVQIEELPEEDLEVVEIQSDLPIEDIKFEEMREALIKDVETTALRDKLNEMHNNLIELQIENAKLKFERDGHKDDMESYRKRLLATLQEVKQLLQESYLLEENNSILKRLKDDLATERQQTHQEMIEKMLMAKKAARISNEMELALQHLSRAYENQRIKAKKTIEKINKSESIIKKMQLRWDELVAAVQEKCRSVREIKIHELSKSRNKTKESVNNLLSSIPDVEITESKKKKVKPKEKKPSNKFGLVRLD